MAGEAFLFQLHFSCMTRTALILQYNGTAYHGWQYQDIHVPTVQMLLEQALSQVAGGEIIKVHCAGRTDAGVHASAQVVHFEHQVQRDTRAWVEGVNTLLPNDIAVQWAAVVSDEFHARFSAESRRYRYLIVNKQQRPGLFSSQLTWFRHPLDEKNMHEAAQFLLGENDFQAYRGAGCQSKSSFRNVTEITVNRFNEIITIDIEANAFLLHMVRNIVGVLLEIGQGIRPVDWSKTVLESKNRRNAGITAPAQGLHLVQVRYPPDYGIPTLNAPSIQFS